MKILLCHNYYQQPGGEDRVFADEARLLESRGHRVLRFTKHNRQIPKMGRWNLARRTLWNRQTYAELRELIRARRPDVVHCTNIFPLISPAVYDAACAEGVPVVQSLHNYRLLCLNALFLRDGRVCEACLHRPACWPGVRRACYRGSRAASAVVAAMLAVHRMRKTWTRRVDRYIVLSEFARRKFAGAGLPADRMAVKPNFLDPDPGPGTGRGGYVLFAGRLAPEKGIDTLLGAWSRLPERLPLRIVGDGPLAERVRAAAGHDPRIQWLGHRPRHVVQALMGKAACLVFPSVCYETFGRSIIEAFAAGTPVIASRLGAMQELVEDGSTGMCFEPGDADDLAAKILQVLLDPRRTARMRRAARREYQHKYTAETNYRQLMAVYQAGPIAARPRLPRQPVMR
jgi:glycosyltransferase involved in cell wall biosynthesis